MRFYFRKTFANIRLMSHNPDKYSKGHFMTEHMSGSDGGTGEQNNFYEREEQLQQALEAYMLMGAEVSAQRIASEELAKEVALDLDKRLADMQRKGVPLSYTMLRVSGPSVRKANFSVTQGDKSDDLSFTVGLDARHSMRPLAVFEEQLFQAQRIVSCAWEDVEADCWRVGVRLHGNDPVGVVTSQMTDRDGLPILTSHTQASMTVDCNEAAQIEVDALVRRRGRNESIANLDGKVQDGLIVMLRRIDDEMMAGESADYVELKSTHYLRALGKYGMSISKPGVADALSTAISKVLDRESGIIVGGKAYEVSDKTPKGVESYTTINGLVADVIPGIPVETNKPVGLSLVMVNRDGKLKDAKYMPLKDIHQLKY